MANSWTDQSGALRRVTELYKRTLNGVANVAVVLGVFIPLGLLFLENWAWGRTLLERLGLKNPASLTQDFSLAIPMLAIILLATLAAHTNNLVSKVDTLIPKYDDVIGTGIRAVYPRLEMSVSAIRSQNERTLEILGLTMRTVTDPLSDWFQQGLLKGWTIIAYCIDPTYLDENPAMFPEDWGADARAAKNKILKEAKAHLDLLRTQGITIELNTYRNLPAIHGFRLGNREIFFSLIEWNGASKTLCDPNHYYEHIRRGDDSPRAEIYREVFQNWLQKAKDSQVETYRPTDASFPDVNQLQRGAPQSTTV